MLNNDHCPLFQKDLSWFQRFMYCSGVWAYIVGAITTPMFIIIPLVSVFPPISYSSSLFPCSSDVSRVDHMGYAAVCHDLRSVIQYAGRTNAQQQLALQGACCCHCQATTCLVLCVDTVRHSQGFMLGDSTLLTTPQFQYQVLPSTIILTLKQCQQCADAKWDG